MLASLVACRLWIHSTHQFSDLIKLGHVLRQNHASSILNLLTPCLGKHRIARFYWTDSSSEVLFFVLSIWNTRKSWSLFVRAPNCLVSKDLVLNCWQITKRSRLVYLFAKIGTKISLRWRTVLRDNRTGSWRYFASFVNVLSLFFQVCFWIGHACNLHFFFFQKNWRLNTPRIAHFRGWALRSTSILENADLRIDHSLKFIGFLYQRSPVGQLALNQGALNFSRIAFFSLNSFSLALPLNRKFFTLIWRHGYLWIALVLYFNFGGTLRTRWKHLISNTESNLSLFKLFLVRIQQLKPPSQGLLGHSLMWIEFLVERRWRILVLRRRIRLVLGESG